MKRSILNSVRIIVVALAFATCLALVGCGSQLQDGKKTADNSTDNPVVVRVGTTPTPGGELFREVEKDLEGSNIKLEIKEFTDYITPNKALSDGSIDVNFFQHVPYLEDYNQKNGTNLVPIKEILLAPLAIYPGTSSDLSQIKDGAKIAIPNDTTNEARALLLLQAQKLIKLKDGVGLEATPKDVAENPKNIQFVEVEAAAAPGVRKDVDFAIINVNFAVSAGIQPEDALVAETKDSEAAERYPNVLVVRPEDKDNPAIQKVADTLTSDRIREFINTRFKGAIIPLF